jgi:hypothetical protein
LGAREKAVFEEGTEGGAFGQAITMVSAVKLFTLLMVMALGTWISGYTLGVSADDLLDWFNSYEDKTDDEHTNDDGERDPDGTSARWDLLYHAITAGYAFVVLTAIEVGGVIFGFTFGTFGGPIPDCDVKDAEPSAYVGIKEGINNLRDGTYDNCMANMKLWFE